MERVLKIDKIYVFEMQERRNQNADMALGLKITITGKCANGILRRANIKRICVNRRSTSSEHKLERHALQTVKERMSKIS